MRRALLKAADSSEPWLQAIQFLLFAPCDNGAKLLRFARDSWLPARLRLLTSPALEELKPGSPTLGWIRRRTEEHLALETGAFVTPVEVVVAEKDRVVVPGTLPGDPIARTATGKGHISVCKPTGTYGLPLQLLLQYAQDLTGEDGGYVQQ